MCLKLRRPALKPIIAQRDITVYKDLRHWTSPYQGHPYVLGNEYTVDLKNWEETKARAATLRGDTFTHGLLHGFHTYARKDHFDPDGTVHRAIIPKGAEYYRGDFCGNASLISNRLVVFEPLVPSPIARASMNHR